MRIVAEHARAAAFLIADGVMPSNEGRGYVLRRIMRRAAYFGRRHLDVDIPVMAELAKPIIRAMAQTYADLEEHQEVVMRILRGEEQRFEETLARAAKLADSIAAFKTEQGAVQLFQLATKCASRLRESLAEYRVDPSSAEDIDWNRENRAKMSQLCREWKSQVEWIASQPGRQNADALFFYSDHFLNPLEDHIANWTHEIRLLAALDWDAFKQFHKVQRGVESIEAALVEEVAKEGRWDPTAIGAEPILGEFLPQLQKRLDLAEEAAKPRHISGLEGFVLYDTYGLPKDVMADIAHARGLAFDDEAFDRLLEAQREQSRAASRFGGGGEEREKAYAALSHLQTRFVGYDTLRHQSTVAAIIVGAEVVESAQEGDEVELVLHETPFYAEGGGQVGDQGVIEVRGSSLESRASRFEVEDTQWAQEGVAVHRGRVVEGRIAVNDAVVAQVDAEKRRDTMRNHTATHLLQAALRRVLGTHVRQSGSLVAPDRLRFDFTHMSASGGLKPEELLAVQRLVNEKIREDIEVHPEDKGYEEAIAGGALAFFGEKYADRVRVVEIAGQPDTEEHAGLPAGQAGPSGGRYSMELCGGTHCRSTGEIGSFIIVREESIGAGLRRIEAVTGRGAEEYVQAQRDLLERLSRRTGVTPADLETKVASLLEEMEAERRRAQALERDAARRAAEVLLAGAERLPVRQAGIDSVAVVAGQVPAASFEVMREAGDWLRDRLGSAVLVLGAVFGERPNFVAMITPDLTARGLHAGELVKRVAAVTGGGGGGRPEMAQAGGKDPSRLEEALGLARKLARESLSALPPEKGSPSPPASTKGGPASGGGRAGKGR